MALAQDNGTGSDQPPWHDNDVLDQFEIPFGEWMDQSVDWIDVNLDWLLKAIEWPFDFLIRNFVDDFLVGWVPWWGICLAFFVLGSLIRNMKVGAFTALALAACGILGNDYWLETARTIGFIGVAVLLCVLIGIPVGVVCGRVDSVWKVVRPLLDAMQVVHSFVYMLPFIFFFGIGPVSATMVTMVFALPPLIRLTNLGIRQVPEDVVEASRAYGAPEWRVLADVQLPLARPAIMTGLNQTLLLAISMLGIAAIMGAGGLGRLLFRALSNQDVALATSGGLAFFLVAVVLDRISQREESDTGNLLRRIRMAWTHRRDPEVLIPVDDDAPKPQASSWHFAPVTQPESRTMAVAGAGALLAFIGTWLTWTTDAGKYSAYGRRVDEDLAGESYSGLAASGGSWFGLIVFGLSLFVIAAVISAYRRPGAGPRWLAGDGAVIASLAMFITMVVYVLGAAPDRADVGTGIGVWISLVGALVAAVGAIGWVRLADHSPLHPLSADIAWGRIVGVSIAVVIIFVGSISGWSFDGRADVVISDEIQAEIARLEQAAIDNPADAGAIAAELSGLMSTAQSEATIVTDGFSSDGPQLGLWTLLLGIVGFAVALPAAGVFGRNEHHEWVWSAITAGVGAGIALVATGWIATHVRSADPNFFSGIGSFLVLCGGVFIAASSGGVLGEFRRTKIYDDAAEIDLASAGAGVGAPIEEPVEELI